jgi:hypothetical protein
MTPHTYVPDFTVRCYQEQVLSCRRPDVISSRHPRFMRIRKKKSAQKYAAEFCLLRATSGAPPRPHVLPSRPCPWRGNFRGFGRPSRRTLPPLPPAGELPAPGSMTPLGLPLPGRQHCRGTPGLGPVLCKYCRKLGPALGVIAHPVTPVTKATAAYPQRAPSRLVGLKVTSAPWCSGRTGTIELALRHRE